MPSFIAVISDEKKRMNSKSIRRGSEKKHDVNR
jgi:hypothetical protein